MVDQRSAPPLVVTISAAYGAGGSVIAPRLAERLGMPWLDRLVPSTVAEHAGERRPVGDSPLEEGLSDREEATQPASRVFLYLARAAGANVMAPAEITVDHHEQLRARAEAEITDLCARGGVLLGRAGAVVLARRASTYHIRLDGPPDRRVERAAEIEALTIEEARRRMDEVDRARMLYVRRLYRADPTETSLYHLVVDTTVLDPGHAVELLASAVDAYAAAALR